MERNSRSSGLQKKFFIALLIVGILPGVAALIATYLYSTYSLKHSIGSGFQEIARSTAIRIAAAVDTEIDRAVRLAAVPMLVRQTVELANQQYTGKSEREVHNLLAAGAAAWPRALQKVGPSPLAIAQTTAYLTHWTRDAGYYVRVVIADSRGAVVASTDHQIPYLNADQEWWQEAFGAGLRAAYVSTLRYDRQLNEYVFDVAVPILDENDEEPIGVVGLVIRRGVLMNTILPIRVGKTGHGTIRSLARPRFDSRTG